MKLMTFINYAYIDITHNLYLQLKKFNPKTMADDKVCVFVGKRNTGKSTFRKGSYSDQFYEKNFIYTFSNCVLF